jgi:prepilin-type N-terminal cleavage/methylation domain-containing protein
MRQRTESAGRRARSGFTLLELLVVLAIIATLVALSAAAIMRFTGVQQISNTRDQLVKLGSIVRDRWKIETNIFRTEPMDTTVKTYMDTTFGTTGNEGLRRVIWIKLRLRQTFPMTFAEALTPPSGLAAGTALDPLPVYKNYLMTTYGVTSSTTAPFESAACLLMALQRGSSGAGFQPDDLGRGSTLNLTAGSVTIPALVDAWGSPLQFYRWPTGDPILNPGGAQAGAGNDPTDPTGLLESPTWLSANGAAFATVFGYTPPSATAGGAAQSYRLEPLIVSWGPDGLLGLDTVTATPTVSASGTNDSADNISTATPPQ